MRTLHQRSLAAKAANAADARPLVVMVGRPERTKTKCKRRHLK